MIEKTGNLRASADTRDTSPAKKVSYEISARTRKSILDRLRANRRVRRSLPGCGRLNIDRQLPFLAVYRRRNCEVGQELQQLVSGEASYLWATAKSRQKPELEQLVSSISTLMQELFGAFLLVEVWPSAPRRLSEAQEAKGVSRPHFRIILPKDFGHPHFVCRFQEALSRIRLQKQCSQVELVHRTKVAPEHMTPLLATGQTEHGRQVVIGLEVNPVYLDPENEEIYPVLLREMARALGIAFKRLFFEFSRDCTTSRPPHYQSLGRRSMVRAVWKADRNLCEVSDQFDFLLQISPVNGSHAWEEFRRSHYKKKPVFHYRPLPIDPILLKRKLFATPVEGIEDPVIGQLFRDKMRELDLQLTLLDDRDTPAFLPGSIQLCGPVEQDLRDLALSLMKARLRSPAHARETSLSAQTFAERAKEEIDFLRTQDPAITTRVSVQRDVTGLMVSQGTLLIGSELKVPGHRVEALIQHEIGTHVLTYANGRAQPFRQLYAGLAGYEALQEGLAVFAEYLVGGLDVPRLRLIAARVLACGALEDGMDFRESFELMHEQYGMSLRQAFFVTMRVFRGGGLNKDAIYLRGLVQVLEILQKGTDLKELLIGKISTEQIPLIQELRWRKVLVEPMSLPRYLDWPEAQERLTLARGAVSVADLLDLQRRVAG